MAKRYPALDERLTAFIGEQKIYFVATATSEGRINLSPKGLDTLRILGPNRIVWLNLTGSGNETAAHLLADGRMTLMFCSFAGAPMILRLYGRARAVHDRDPEWPELATLLPPLPGARQIVDMEVDLVQTSCGYGVPLFDHAGDRETLVKWAVTKGDEEIRRYQLEKNATSLDGLPTGTV